MLTELTDIPTISVFSAEDEEHFERNSGSVTVAFGTKREPSLYGKKWAKDFKQPKVFASDSGNSTLQTARFGAELGYRHPASFINCFIFYHQLSFDPCPTVPKEYHFLLSNCCKKVTFP